MLVTHVGTVYKTASPRFYLEALDRDVKKPHERSSIGVLLCALAVTKAALVAMYFMHLKLETRTLGLIAVTPLAIATLLVFVLLPDGFAVAKKTADEKKVAAPAAAEKH